MIDSDVLPMASFNSTHTSVTMTLSRQPWLIPLNESCRYHNGSKALEHFGDEHI